MKRRLFIVYNSEIDESIERMNEIVEVYIRSFINYAQSDWFWLLSFAKLVLKNRDFSTTDVFSFFLTHEYNLNLIESRLTEESRLVENSRSLIERADVMIIKLKNVCDWAQMSMTFAQQLQENYVNKKRDSIDQFEVNEKMWLDLRNIRIDRSSKKFDARHKKFTIKKKIESHVYRLNTSLDIHDVFHVRLLRLVVSDSFLSQNIDHSEPSAILVIERDEEISHEEFEVKNITKKRRRRDRHEYWVKWVEYEKSTWESANVFIDIVALNRFEQQKSRARQRTRQRVDD